MESAGKTGLLIQETLYTAQALKVLEIAYQTRFLDEKLSSLAKQNKGGTFHLSPKGHELVGAVCALGLISKKDWSLPYYRDQAFPIGLGCDLVDIIGTFLGRDAKTQSSGRMMPYHYSDSEMRILCQSSPVGSQFLQATGRAYGVKQAKSSEVVYVSGGEGSTSQGDFHEALNFSCIHKLPVIFVIQDNGWAISVPIREQTAGGSILKITNGYEGLTSTEVNGSDVAEMTKAFSLAVQKAREGNGPSVILTKIPRLAPHSSSDDQKKYREAHALEEDIKNDPIHVFEQNLLESGLVDEAKIEVLKNQAKAFVDEKAKEAEALPLPTPESVELHIFKDFEVESGEENLGSEVVMMDAINHALQEEMERDPNTYVFGQDVAKGKGGVFGLTRGLTERFGEDRCFNTPLAESTIIGLSLGLSSGEKQRVISEIQFSDYVWTGMNQLMNEISSFHWRANGEWSAPLVIRIPCGGYIQGGPYHSQSIEAYLAHCPGLKVVMPSNAYDAKALLKAAIRDPNPVIFLEHKLLYRQRVFSARKEPSKDFLLPFGKANTTLEGSDMTVVSWGYTLVMAHEIAERLKKEDYSIEVIDLRTIVPLDEEAILKSVQKTGKLLVIHEDAKNGGFGAEISARINEKAFEFLDAPIKRVCGKNTPIGYSKVLENATLPQKEDIEIAMRELLDY
ncbi:MAG: 1-deoxy-D-xylulose-5-phosphate synthase [Chlamydiae bacterium]|nr:1-deoxy-D-xylulose-5-phosphate synthase [Chlamydiota bacterium]